MDEGSAVAETRVDQGLSVDPPPVETTDRPQAKPPQGTGETRYFRTGLGAVFNEKGPQYQNFVKELEGNIDENPPTFRPETEDIQAVLDHIKKPEEQLKPVPPRPDIKTHSQVEPTEEQMRRVAADVQKHARTIVREAQKLESSSRDRWTSHAGRMLKTLGPLLITLTALIPRDSEDVSRKEEPTFDQTTMAVDQMNEPMPSAQEPLVSETSSQESVEYTVQPGDSITGILDKLHPGKWKDESGQFKVDDAAQDELYREVRKVISLNRDLITSQNPALMREIDNRETDLGRTLSGLELRSIVEETGGPNQVVIIQPGQVLKFPKESGIIQHPSSFETPPTQPLTPEPIQP